jgi:outer membrane lipoprotein SlyB
MRKFILGLSAIAVALPSVAVFPASSAEARRSQYREWRGRDGRVYCRKSNGTTGLIVGGVGGALVGRTIDTRGDRTLGTLGGAALGALAGREVDREVSRPRRCR